MNRVIFFVCTILPVIVSCTSHEPDKAKTADYLNPNLPLEHRVDDLLARMTLEEKVSQMMNQSPAIPRLGIEEYNWWSEGLHGVARAGIATVFPQAIGLAAMWDRQALYDVATAISDEARAKHHAFAAKGKRNLYQGLTLWSPNINLFRDPRWGRGQETYGEDPYLTGELAVQFIRGLQGDDPRYLKTVATVKHFAVHSGPEPQRHHFNAVTGNKDLYESYLPMFEKGIKQGGAYSLMCAYNRYNGKAACGSDLLLRDVLRRDWDFSGFVVSDCGAIEDIHAHHKLTENGAQSAALAVKSGTDLNCGKVYQSLTEAVKAGMLTEEQLDISLARLLRARFKLGMFDPADMVPYQHIPYSVVDSEKHRQLALQAAQKSIVLLKNDKQTLPLSKELKKIAVIGPNADEWLMLLGNYNGVPAAPVTPVAGIKQKLGQNTQILTAQGSDLAEGIPVFSTVPAGVLQQTSTKAGLHARFFNNIDLSGQPLFEQDMPQLAVNWRDRAPRSDMDDDHFSVSWETELVPQKDGEYQLGVITTCNTQLWLDGKLIADTPYHFRNEYGDPRLRKSTRLALKAGLHYKIKVTAIETYADAQVELVWAPPQQSMQQQAVDIASQADAVVLVMGLTARMEGEEMEVKTPGFNGGDRTSLALPYPQQELIKAVSATGKPVVLVLLNGSALAVNWADKHVNAIVEAWYPGQAAGQAIADVLFGDYNPAGRLPVTFYHSVKDLPGFDDYHFSTQTYRYFTQQPLYPFGYGLSYSQFAYSELNLPRQLKAGQSFEVKVKLKNTSAIAGDEVAQLYISPVLHQTGQPLRSLKGFQRIRLQPGEQQTLTFTLSERDFVQYNPQGEAQLVSGDYLISVGGGQPDVLRATRSNVVQQRLTIIE
ncbi:beta-glucosidase [Neptunicella marina]|uniref:Glycoside hydrolase family 3 C-terminal domain-containing protein n=1 Tax=Neptunicella marina TaxID=2125989 RepID=A0A8J6IUQ6_9ALTE|nr:beta-glucosidase [Neptunicella marina]MBC3765986.1 glycoside hydrolase family 3 C-terminal domain-containing protein [Neptunicella marina]